MFRPRYADPSDVDNAYIYLKAFMFYNPYS